MKAILTLFAILMISLTSAQQVLSTDIYGNIYNYEKNYSESEIKATLKQKLEIYLFARNSYYEGVLIFNDSNSRRIYDPNFRESLRRMDVAEKVARDDYFFWFIMALEKGYKWAPKFPIRIISAWDLWKSQQAGLEIYDLYSYNQLGVEKIRLSEQKIFIDHFKGEF